MSPGLGGRQATAAIFRSHPDHTAPATHVHNGTRLLAGNPFAVLQH